MARQIITKFLTYVVFKRKMANRLMRNINIYNTVEVFL